MKIQHIKANSNLVIELSAEAATLLAKACEMVVDDLGIFDGGPVVDAMAGFFQAAAAAGFAQRLVEPSSYVYLKEDLAALGMSIEPAFEEQAVEEEIIETD